MIGPEPNVTRNRAIHVARSMVNAKMGLASAAKDGMVDIARCVSKMSITFSIIKPIIVIIVNNDILIRW